MGADLDVHPKVVRCGWLLSGGEWFPDECGREHGPCQQQPGADHHRVAVALVEGAGSV